jgi:DNA mismatch repair protein MutS
MSATTKPMYTKYYTVWKEHAERYGPRTALLYQVGGFYEIYDTENLTTGRTHANVREIAEICQLSLTVHAVDSSTQTLFGGVPDYALAKYEKILVNAGYTVVVVGQRKNARGSVEERVVDHISSPGLYIDGAIQERRLVGVVLESLGDGAAALRRVYWAAAALDLATGRIWFVEGADRDRLHQFLCMHPPAELVIWSDGGAGSSAIADSLRGACSAVHLRCLAPASAAVEEAALDRHWMPARKRLGWINGRPQARRALAALMDFAADHVPSALKALDEPEAWVPDGEVRLGNAALEQLGLLSLRAGADDKQSLLGLLDQCRSVAGRRLMRSRLMRPISDIGVLQTRYDAIDHATAAAISGEVTAATERGLRSLYDMSRLWRRVELGSASAGDMSCLLRAYEAAAALMGLWPRVPPGAREYLASIAERWSTDIVVEMARDGVSVPVTTLPWFPGSGCRPEVEALFAEGVAIRDRAVALAAEWSGLGRREALYLDDAEGGGFRITGTKRRVTSVLAALRDAGDCTAKVTPYKTTALIETDGLEALTAKHRSWMHRWAPVWVEAWAAAIGDLAMRGRAIHAAIEGWCAEIDLAWTVARLTAEWRWVRPTLVEAAEGLVEVEGLRHPILERLTTVPYVAHSVGLGQAVATAVATEATVQSNRGLLLYGMNASGKSSLMKALGLATLLAQCGFPVPAKQMRLSPFTAIFTRILGNDNLWAGLSSFAVEMTEFREILRFADERSLVLGDELCSGTESLSATALVAAGVETLAARGTKFVFATHLHDLATMVTEAGGVRAVHLKVHYEAATDRLIYDRTLAAGSGSALYGLEVCRALDLPIDYLERAMVLRKTLAGEKPAVRSTYSAAAVVDRCAVCSSQNQLEMHHIHHQADGGGDEASNLACLCAICHDDHHGGRLTITGWQDTSAGRRLVWSRTAAAGAEPAEDVAAWVREQRRLKIRIATIQRMAKQIFGVELTEKWIRGCH